MVLFVSQETDQTTLCAKQGRIQTDASDANASVKIEKS
jgi:hypothetical protein